MKRLLLLLSLILTGVSAGAQVAPRLVVQAGHAETVETLRVSPDGRLLASLSKDSLRIWQRGGALLWSAPMQGQVVGAMTWNLAGDKIAVGYGGVSGFLSVRPETAGVWEFAARDGARLRQLPFGNNTIYNLRYQADGALIAVSGEGTVSFAPDGTRTKQNIGNAPFPSAAGGLEVRLKAGEQGQDGTRQIVDAATGAVRANLPFNGTLIWSGDGQILADFDGQKLWVWRANGARLTDFHAPRATEYGARLALAIAPDGKSVVCARTDFPNQQDDSTADDLGAPRAFLWRVNTETGDVAALASAARRAIDALAFWPDGTLGVGGARYFIDGISQGELFLARPTNDKINALWSAPQPLYDVEQLAISTDGRYAATAGGDTAVRLWNTRTGRLEKTLKTFSNEMLALAFSPDNTRVAALDYSSLYLFDARTGAAKTYAGQGVFDSTGNSVVWSPDGGEVAFATGIETRVLNVKTGTIRVVKSIGSPLRWTRQGWWTSGGGGGLELRDPISLQVLARLNGSGVGSEATIGDYYQRLSAFDFAPQSDALVTLVGKPDPPDGPTQIKIWNVSHNRVDRTIGDIGDALSLSVAPDGQSFVVGARSGKIAVYQISDARLICTTQSDAPANDVKWSNDGTRIFVAGGDGKTRVFDAHNGVLKATLVITPARAADKTSYNWLRTAPDGGFDGTPGALDATRVFDASGTRVAISDLKRVAQLPLSGGAALAPKPFVVALKDAATVAPAAPKPKSKSGPRLILQGDKIEQFSELAIANGAAWLASSQGSEGPIQLWQGKDALQWGTLPAASGDKPLVFTPDATRLLTQSTVYNADQDSARTFIKVCAIPSGRVLRQFEIAPLALWCDNARLRAVVGAKLVDYDLTSGKIVGQRAIQSAPKYPDNSAPRYAFSRSGAFLIEGSRGTIRWWNAGSGRLLGQIKDSLRAIGQTAISDDGARLASEGDDPSWSPPAEASSEAAYARQFQLHIWNARTHKLERTFPGYGALDGGARLLQFARDGAILLAAGDHNLDRFSAATGKDSPLPPAKTDFKKGLQWPLAISSDGAFVGGAGQIYQSNAFAPGLQVWSLAQSKKVAQLPGALRGASRLRWSPDGKYLAGGDRLTLWDAQTGALLAERPDAYLEAFEWLDNSTIRSRNSEQIQLWHAPDLKLLPGGFDTKSRAPKVDDMSLYSDGILVSPDGKTYLTTNIEKFGGRDELWIWDAATQQVARKIKLHFDDNRFNFTLDKAIWIDNARIAFGTYTGFQVINVQSGAIAPEQRDPTDPNFTGNFSSNALTPLVASDDDAFLAVGAARDSTILIYDARTLQFLRRLPVKSAYISYAHFLRDNQTLVAPTNRGLEFWNVANSGAQPQRVLKNVPSGDWHFSPDEKLLVFGAGYTSQGVTICDAQTGAVRVRLYLLGGDSQSTSLDWIALTPAGFYDASPAGEKRLRWREDGKFWPLEKSRARFHRPDLVAAALK